jgi:hypothetical protein
MQTFNDEQKERDIEFFGPFKSLWKTDDPEWVAKRQAAWLAVHGDANDPHTKFREKYYVYGEEPPSYIGARGNFDNRVAFEFNNRVAFMPYQNAEQVTEFWQTVLKRYSTDHKRMHTAFLRIGNELKGFPERDNIVKLVTETLFTPDYFMCLSDSNFVPEGTLETIDPRDFVIDYSRISRFYNKNNKYKWDYRNFSFDYFMLSVRDCEESGRLTPHYVDVLPKMYKYLLTLEDSGLSKYRIELKQALMDAAVSQDAPILLKNAFAEARARLNN